MQKEFTVLFDGHSLIFVDIKLQIDSCTLETLNEKGYSIRCINSFRNSNEELITIAICDYNSSNKKLGIGGN